MSKVLLKSIVKKLKEKQNLSVDDVIAISRFPEIQTPSLKGKIQEYLSKNKKLTHAQYCELISMANGFPNFDYFNVIYFSNKNEEFKIDTGSVLLDYFMKQFPSGFKIFQNIAFPDIKKELEYTSETLPVIRNYLKILNLKESENGSPIVINLYQTPNDFVLLEFRKLKDKFKTNFSELDEVDIPLRKNRIQGQTLIDQEDETYEISCELKIIEKKGNTIRYKDLNIIGKNEFIKLLREKKELLTELQEECKKKLHENFPFQKMPN